ncbi:MAG: ABC transporter substrate-binding protein, partial [Proteobacteria bacterium]|nr:ABC transporter substrate-binding protein [Pseudomonadota bacterium]
IQFVEHPALDQTRKGIIDYLQEHDPTLVIQWESAQGNSALSTQIAQRFVGQKVSAIVTIATVPSQAALQAAQGTTIPVIFASVSDPQGAKLTGNITGVSNYIDAKEQFMFFKQILPRLTTLGIIYNPGEPNSVSLNALMEKRAQEMGLKLVFVQAPRTSEVSTAAQSLVSKVDAIFINNDSTALAAFESIIAIATTYKIPVFASDIDVVKKGALAVLGPNQYYIGTQAGAITQNLVKEKALASTIDVEYPHQVEVYLNQKIADALGIVFDPSLQATTILKE